MEGGGGGVFVVGLLLLVLLLLLLLLRPRLVVGIVVLVAGLVRGGLVVAGWGFILGRLVGGFAVGERVGGEEGRYVAGVAGHDEERKANLISVSRCGWSWSRSHRQGMSLVMQ